MQQKQLEKGAFSVVSRPHPSILPQGQPSYVWKRSRSSLSQHDKKSVHKKYLRQKRMLDYLRQQNPSKAQYFNQIYQITPQNHVKMKDLGNVNLFHFQNSPVYASPFFEQFDRIVSQLIDAFLVMWKSDIVHRDIKPENIMVPMDISTRLFNISLVDFTDSLRKEDIPQLRGYSLSGTTYYMSPEMLDRKYQNPKDSSPGTWEEYLANDLWSLGLVLYIMVYKKNLVDMFKTMFFVEEGKHPEPENKFVYDILRGHQDVYDELFLTENLPPHRRKYVPMIKALLSMDPNNRLRWWRIKNHQLQQKARQAASQLLSASQKRQKKRARYSSTTTA